MKAPKSNLAAMKATATCLIKTNEDVTPDTGREMDLSLQIQLDTDGQCSTLQVAIVVDRALEKIACELL